MATTPTKPSKILVVKCNECPLSGPFNYGDKCELNPKVTRIGGAVPTFCPLRDKDIAGNGQVEVAADAEIRSHQ